MMEFESVIGLEVHAQLSTKSKLWCSCSTQYASAANSQTCPVCLALPGALPVLNEMAVEYAVKFGLAVQAKINLYSEFSRKNYFYQDLPAGYQITQYEIPILEGGSITADIGEVGETRYPVTIRLERTHIENDTGKTIHDDQLTGKNRSFVDFNRAGTPLIEIVTKPDFRSGKEAYYYLMQLRQILIFLEICDGNMEEGSLRCDANVSIRPLGQEKFGTKVEVKNMNSFRNVERAINFEINRQKEIYQSGGTIIQETRMWDAQNSETKSMRSKEDAMDYRYFPEPDLIPLQLSQEYIDPIKASMPELPHHRRQRFIETFLLPYDDANTLTSDIQLADYFERCLNLTTDPKLTANWILSEVLKITNEYAIKIQNFSIKEDRLAGLINLIKNGTISGKIAKQVFEEMLNSTDNPELIVKNNGWVQITDNQFINDICKQVIELNPSQLNDYLNGKDKLFGFFVGQCLKLSQGKANPELINQILRRQLDDLRKLQN